MVKDKDLFIQQLAENWGLESTYQVVQQQLNRIYLKERNSEKAGEIIHSFDCIDSARLENQLTAHSQEDKPNKPQFAQWLFEKEPENKKLQDNRLPILGVITSTFHLKTIAEMSQVGLKVISDIQEKPSLARECKSSSCVVLVNAMDDEKNESKEKVFVAFTDYDSLHRFKSQGPQARSELRKLIGQYERAYYLLADKELALSLLGEGSNVADDSAVGIILNEDRLQKLEKSKRWADVLNEAIARGASDIHMEPFLLKKNNYVNIRLRIDGDLTELSKQKTFQYTLSEYNDMVAYLQSMTKATQHGAILQGHSSGEKFTYTTKGGDVSIEARPQFAPMGGNDEHNKPFTKVVMRIWKYSEEVKSLEDIKVSETVKKYLHANLLNDDGLTMVVGPTGSGKTTFMLAQLKLLTKMYNGTQNISSIEEPREQILEGMSQFQYPDPVRKAVLQGDKTEDDAIEEIVRSFKRQDIDKVFVGEIRSAVVAYIAGSLASTGHQTFCTFHAKDPENCLTQISLMLQKINSSDVQFFTSLKHIYYTSLVKGSCPDCRIKGKVSEKLIDKLVIKKGLSEEHAELLKGSDLYFNDGLQRTTIDNEESGDSTTCTTCNGSGIVGRIPVIGIFNLDRERKVTLLDVNNGNRFFRSTEKPYHCINQDLIDSLLEGRTTVEAVLNLSITEENVNV